LRLRLTNARSVLVDIHVKRAREPRKVGDGIWDAYETSTIGPSLSRLGS
jgi:hypothetical protein